MSQNVELVRRFYALSPDLRDVDPNDPAIFDVAFVHGRLDEEFELRPPADYPEGESIFRGREGFRRFLVMMRDVWAEWRIEPERFFDAGDKGGGVHARGGQGQRQRGADQGDRRNGLEHQRGSPDVGSGISRPLGGPRSSRAETGLRSRQRGIRSSGQFTTISRFAQGWQGSKPAGTGLLGEPCRAQCFGAI